MRLGETHSGQEDGRAKSPCSQKWRRLRTSHEICIHAEQRSRTVQTCKELKYHQMHENDEKGSMRLSEKFTWLSFFTGIVQCAVKSQCPRKLPTFGFQMYIQRTNSLADNGNLAELEFEPIKLVLSTVPKSTVSLNERACRRELCCSRSTATNTGQKCVKNRRIFLHRWDFNNDYL